MTPEPALDLKNLQFWLNDLGYDLVTRENTGSIFLNKTDDICLIIDTIICELSDHPYVSYTTRQNELMHTHDRVFRFLFDRADVIEELKEKIQLFLKGESDPEKLRRFGGNRAELEPDPTPPEDIFEDCFFQAFGDRARMGLRREFAYYDLNGTRRFIDYALFGHSIKFAIELNGETWHHPHRIGPKKYRSQLFKQNSMVADGFKVFRWSMSGMKDRERFILELSRFMGYAQPFLDKSVYKVKRRTFTLKAHQEKALDQLRKVRHGGQSTFLLVLPTGTGKTEIFIKDIADLKQNAPELKSLVIVPTRKLRDQTMERFRLRLPGRFKDSVSIKILKDSHADFLVQTSAYMHRHYYKIKPDFFNYIVVDEAHHAAAQGLRSILSHFCPDHLLGVTATPERFDQQNLEELFGEYEPQLSLEDAIREGLVPPVRCYRIKSNIDLSEVRFNGREFVKNDLQTTLLVPSRDLLIAKILKQYFEGEFSQKQGVVFCVDIKHAKRMAKLLNKEGIASDFVAGKDGKNVAGKIKAYDEGTIRFMCACDLLTEGWDSPQTSILVMARPTFSKVLYTQQIGRGLRNHPGKEALYVIDVVDNYGAGLNPMSLHSLFKMPGYKPFENLVKPGIKRPENEIFILDGLYEGVRKIEPVDIFTFEQMYGSFLNVEQLARELFVSTGTVKTWLRKGKIFPDVQYPFGNKKLHFFDPEKIEEIRKELGLKEHNDETRLSDFFEFLENRDYTFSYKIIFLLGFFKICNERYQVHLAELVNLYTRFYERLMDKHGNNEKRNSPYNRGNFIGDPKAMQRSLLANPFEKFERKRFFYHCKDLDYIAMDPVLATQFTREHYDSITEQMDQDLCKYYKKLEISLVETDYSFLMPESDFKRPAPLFIQEPDEKEKYTSVLPFYPLDIAAGYFTDKSIHSDPETWFRVMGRTTRSSFSSSMFIAQVKGQSMEPRISDGSYCLFSFEVGGTRNGQIVLAQKAGAFDPDTGFSYTIKTYHSSKKQDPDTGWRHENIILKSVNPDYQDIVIPSDEGEDFRVIAFFMEVLSAHDNNNKMV